MNLLLRRREMMPHEKKWRTLIHNNFDTYYQYTESGGNDFVVKDNGEWVEIVSNGQNKNSTTFIVNPLFDLNNVGNKECRFTWNIECDDETQITTSNCGFFVTIGSFLNKESTSGNPLVPKNRKEKKDVASLALQNIFGYHEYVFTPLELLTNSADVPYFGWNIGCRSAVDGLTFRILQFDFAVFE